jgi:hypothetical protein
MVEKMLTLKEAFRTVLRARYPSRPALADEVESAHYFYPPYDGSVRPIEEVQAARDACDVLKDAIANQSVRLHGRRLNCERPDDINPTEITRAGISIFDNVLDVWQPTTRVSQFRQLPNYLNVHCYAADIAALIGAAEPSPRANGAKRQPRAVAQEAIKACFPEQGGDVDLPDGPFLKRIFGWLEKERPAFASISNRTVLRAAGRAK